MRQVLEGVAGLKEPTMYAKVIERLRKRYEEDLLLEQFTTPNDSGYSNRADAIGISCHPSRSTNIEYFEIKASRSDWLNELKKPSKSHLLTKYCDKIWLVTTSQDIAQTSEIPDNWGWMFLKGKRLVVGKEAPKLEPDYDRGFIIRIAQYSKREFNKQIAKEYWKVHEEVKDELEQKAKGDYWRDEAKRYTELYEKQTAVFDAFEKASGISIYSFANIDNLKEIGTIAKSLFEIREAQKKIGQELSEESLECGWELRAIKRQMAVVENTFKELAAIPLKKEKEGLK
jgi:hypothetical protein